MRLSDLQKEQRTFTADILGSEVNLTYRHNFITSEVEASLNDISNGTSANRVSDLFAVICGIVSEWDVLDDNDTPIPLTVESLKEHGCTLEVANAVLNAVMEDSTRVNP